MKRRRQSMTSPQETKKKKKKPSPVNQFLSLPDDFLFSCFARISRLYYPVLSLVSKSFRSLLTSPGLYETRASLGHTENSLYVCLRFPSDPNPRWYTLGLVHDHHNLFPIPIPHSPPLHSSSLIVLGSDIYNIGGSSKETPSSNVSILDCTSHTWREAPSMLVKRKYPCFRVTDEKIYVRGGGGDYNSSSSPWMEVFDPKTKTWEPVSERSAEFLSTGTTPTLTDDNDIKLKFIDTASRCFVRKTLNPTDYRWNIEFVRPRRAWNLAWNRNRVFSSYCLIDDVMYGYADGVFKWFDTKVTSYSFNNLKGFPKIDDSSFVKLMNYGGKLAVLWDKIVPTSGCEKNRVIECAVIVLERRNSKGTFGNIVEEMYGSVEWCDEVLTVPESCEFVNALAATV